MRLEEEGWAGPLGGVGRGVSMMPFEDPAAKAFKPDPKRERLPQVSHGADLEKRLRNLL